MGAYQGNLFPNSILQIMKGYNNSLLALESGDLIKWMSEGGEFINSHSATGHVSSVL